MRCKTAALMKKTEMKVTLLPQCRSLFTLVVFQSLWCFYYRMWVLQKWGCSFWRTSCWVLRMTSTCWRELPSDTESSRSDRAQSQVWPFSSSEHLLANDLNNFFFFFIVDILHQFFVTSFDDSWLCLNLCRAVHALWSVRAAPGEQCGGPEREPRGCSGQSGSEHLQSDSGAAGAHQCGARPQEYPSGALRQHF